MCGTCINISKIDQQPTKFNLKLKTNTNVLDLHKWLNNARRISLANVFGKGCRVMKSSKLPTTPPPEMKRKRKTSKQTIKKTADWRGLTQDKNKGNHEHWDMM